MMWYTSRWSRRGVLASGPAYQANVELRSGSYWASITSRFVKTELLGEFGTREDAQAACDAEILRSGGEHVCVKCADDPRVTPGTCECRIEQPGMRARAAKLPKRAKR